MSILAIDYGLRKIGLALSEGSLAQPLPALSVKSPEDALKKITDLIDLNKADLIIFGIPQPDSIGASRFADKLINSGFTLVKVDETLTTYQAKKHQKQKSASEDSIAAAILLQEYLDNQGANKDAI